MQDYNYLYGSCMELTLELSCCKYPYKSELPLFWNDNRQALLAYLGQVHQGVRGFTVDVNGVPVPNVSLRIAGRSVKFRSTAKGEYWRVLLPGTYTLQAEHPNYQSAEKTFTINADGPAGPLAYLNIELLPKGFVSMTNAMSPLELAQAIPCPTLLREAAQSIPTSTRSIELMRSLQRTLESRVQHPDQFAIDSSSGVEGYLAYTSLVKVINGSSLLLHQFVCLPSHQLERCNFTVAQFMQASDNESLWRVMDQPNLLYVSSAVCPDFTYKFLLLAFFILFATFI